MCPIGRGQSMLVRTEGYGKRDMAKTIVEHSHALNNINGPIVYGASSEAEAKQVEIEIGPGVVERAIYGSDDVEKLYCISCCMHYS